MTDPQKTTNAPQRVIPIKAEEAAFDAAKALPANTALANVSMAADGSITSTDQTLSLANLTNVSGVSAT